MSGVTIWTARRQFGHSRESSTQEHAIDATQTRAFGRLALENGQLMPEGENLGLELKA